MSFPPEELNKRGFYLYADFRPETNEWGGRGEVRCAAILNLRRKAPRSQAEGTFRSEDVVKIEEDSSIRSAIGENDEAEKQNTKKSRGITLEEYEAALDADDSFADVVLDTVSRDPLPKAGNED